MRVLRNAVVALTQKKRRWTLLVAMLLGGAVTVPLASEAAATVTGIQTTTYETGSPSPANTGQTITLTATVKANSGTAVPSGTVQFLDNNIDMGSPVGLNSAGVATTTTTASIGNHAYKADYIPSPNAIFLPSTATVTIPEIADNDLTVGPQLPDIQMSATSPSGAVFTYTPPTASDPDDPGAAPPVTCDTPSGSTFPIGTTTVTCGVPPAQAFDDSGPGVIFSVSFTVTVVAEPAQVYVYNLQQLVIGKGPGTSLFDKLGEVQADLDANAHNNRAACAALNAFINQVSVYSWPSSQITFVNQLIATAEQIRAVLGC